jgi:hypothetical protein
VLPFILKIFWAGTKSCAGWHETMSKSSVLYTFLFYLDVAYFVLQPSSWLVPAHTLSRPCPYLYLKWSHELFPFPLLKRVTPPSGEVPYLIFIFGVCITMATTRRPSALLVAVCLVSLLLLFLGLRSSDYTVSRWSLPDSQKVHLGQDTELDRAGNGTLGYGHTFYLQSYLLAV